VVTPLVDKNGCLVHNVAVAGAVPQIRLLYSQILWPSFGTSQLLGGVIPNEFSIGTQVDRPKQVGLLIVGRPTSPRQTEEI
jgi:hypothetical protein